MQNREVVRLDDELGVEVEVEVEAAVGFGFVDGAGHEEVGGVVVALGFDEAGVEGGQLGVAVGEGGGEDLEFFATASLDQRAADEVVDDLRPAAVANAAHEAGDPRAGMRLGEGNAAAFEQREDELEVLQFLDGDGVEFFDARKEVAIFFEIERGGGGLAFEVRVINEDGGELGEDFREPVGRKFLVPQEHGRRCAERARK